MLSQQLLIAYFADTLGPAERAQADLEIAADHGSQRALANQQLMDQALRVALGGPEADERVKRSVLAVVRANSIEQLRAQVLAETSARSTETPSNFANPAPELRNRVAKPHSKGPWRTLRARLTAPVRIEFSLVRRFAVAAAVLLSIGLAIYLFSIKTNPANQIEVGKLGVVVGTPTVHRSGERTASEVRPSAPVRLGDRIETGDADKLEILFRDGTTLRLSFNTVIEIPNPKSEIRNSKSAVGAAGGPLPGIANPLTLQRPPEIKLVAGQVWSKVTKSPKFPQFAIHTPVATAAVKGTEFGLKLQRTTTRANSQSAIGNRQSASPVMAVLTVKEGAVDFFNPFGSVQATAMTESTARAGAKPTEPMRLQTLQVVQLGESSTWSILTSQLDWPDAAERLALGGGWAGVRVRHFQDAASSPNKANATATNEVRVTQVSRSSPGDLAGMRVGDVLVAINTQSVSNADQLNRAFLLRPGTATTLTVRRGGEEMSLTFNSTNHPSILPGPALPPPQRARLAELTRRWMENGVSTSDRDIAALSGAELPGAAQNNLGVILEAGDAMGPAIRAYGRAAYAAPQVPLYHFNLGLALRKIGSFERALEELETAQRLAPTFTDAQKRLAEIHSLLGRDSDALAQTDAALQVNPRDHGLWELKAQILSKQRRFTEAHEAARNGVELEPNCPVMRAYLADALHNMGNLPEAESAYHKALDLAPFDALHHMNLGTVLRDRDQLWPAEQSFRKAIELQPDLALAHRNLGNLLSDEREFAQAEAALCKAVELDPNDAAARRDLGLVALKQRKFAEAEKAYRAALEIWPNDSEACYGLGQALREERQFAEAEKIYRKAIKLKPDYANPHTGLGIVLHERGQFDEAEKLYRKAIELDPKESAPYNNLGNIFRDARGNLDEAEKFYRQALDLSANDAAPYSGLSVVAQRRGNLAEAERLSRKALSLDGDSSSINNTLGEVLRQRGQLDEAEKLYRKALELDPGYIGAYNNLGILLAMRKQSAEAEKVLRALLARAPDLALSVKLPTLVNLGLVCGEQGKLDEAEKLLREALVLSTNHPRVCHALAGFLADHQLKLDEALTLVQQALRAEPNNPNVLDTLGWVQLQRGELGEAEATLKRALELAGQEPPAPEIREHLKKVAEKKGAVAK